MFRNLLLVLTLVLPLPSVMFAVTPPTFPTQFEVIDLGILFGDEESWAKGVNINGYVVGFSKDTDTGNTRPFLYKPSNGAMTELPTASNDIINGDANKISNGNVICGTPIESLMDPFIGFFFSENFLMTAQPLEDMGSVALENLDDSGAACGFASLSGETRAIAVFKGQTYTYDPLVGDAHSRAYGIIGDGVVGVSYNNVAEPRAVLFQNPTKELMTLGGTWSAAYDINLEVAVGSAYLTGDTEYHACGWSDVNQPPKDYGALLGADNSSAIAVNALNDIVGWSESNGSADHRAVVITGVSPTMLDLNTLIPMGSGWVLREAWGISDNRYICGMGEHNGNVRAFLLKPIPPFEALAYYDFKESGTALGWTSLTGIPGFASAALTDGPSGLLLSPNNLFNAFGLWQSPNIELTSDSRYRAYFQITSNQINEEDVPQFRVRVGQQSNNAAWIGNVDSVGNYPPQTGESQIYEVEFLPSFDNATEDIYLAVDLTHFNPSDSNTAIIYVEKAWVEKLE